MYIEADMKNQTEEWGSDHTSDMMDVAIVRTIMM